MSKIQINNSDFVIDRLCADAPRHMWVRELIRNAIEATEHYIKNNPKIKIPVEVKVRALPILNLVQNWAHSKPKFSVLNLGGMSGTELYRATEMASSVNKTQGEDDNFGIGAKVTISKWSDLLFITRKAGKAHICLIGWRNGEFIRIIDVMDYTKWVEDFAFERNYPETEDFTEVVVMGKNSDPKQNTLKHAYGTNQVELNNNFAISNVFRRFVNIPSNIQIRFESGKNAEDTPHAQGRTGYSSGVVFGTWNQCWEKAATQECFHNIIENNEIKYHFYYDAPNEKGKPSTEGTTTKMNATAFSGIIYGKNGMEEYYDVLIGENKKRMFSRLGILSGHEFFRIFVEVPHRLYRNTKYRNDIVKRDDHENTVIWFKDFIPNIRELMPPAFRAKIAEHNTGSQKADIDALLTEALKQYQSDNYSVPMASGSGVSVGSTANGTSAAPKGNKTNTRKNSKKNELTPNRTYDTKSQNSSNMTPELPVFQNYDRSLVIENEMENTFARFIEEGAENGRDLVAINPEHFVVNNLVNKIAFSESVEAGVREWAVKLLQVKVGVTLVLAKGEMKRDGSTFNQSDFDVLTKDQFLTLQAKQNLDLIDQLKRKVKELETLDENNILVA